MQAVHDPLHLGEHVVQRGEAVGQRHALGAGVADVALVPQRHVVKRHLGVRLHATGKAAHALGRDGVALVRHGRRALLALLERFLRLDDVGLLQQAHLHGDGLERCGGAGQRAHDLGVAVARQHLGGQRVGRQAQLLAHVLLNIGVDAGVRAHRAGDGAGRGDLASLLQASLRALERPSPAAELHAERHGLGVDTVRTTDAQSVLELERTALARLAQLFDVVQDDVDGLHDLVRQRGVAQVGGGHAVMHPAAGLFLALGDVGVDVLGHARGEGDDVVVRDLLDLVDALNREVGVVADPLRLLLRDAGLAELGLSLARQHLDFLPDGELVLKLPDGAHGRTRVAVDHNGPFRD